MCVRLFLYVRSRSYVLDLPALEIPFTKTDTDGIQVLYLAGAASYRFDVELRSTLQEARNSACAILVSRQTSRICLMMY